MSRVARLALSLIPALTLACSADNSDEHGSTHGPEFQFGPAPNDPTDAQAHAVTVAAGAEPPGVREDGSIVSAVDWFEGSLEQALELAKTEHKLVFVDVGAYWCPPCHELDEKVFTQAEFGEWLGKRMVAVHIDAEKGEGPELVERYHIQAYPTMLVLESTGVEKDRIIDFVEAGPLQTKLAEIGKGQNSIAALEAAAKDAPEDLETLYQLAHAYTLAAKREQAEALFLTIVAADPTNTAGYASKVFYDRTQLFTMKLDANLEGAIAELEALQRKYPDSKEATKAYRMIGRAACKLGRPDDAIAALDAMIATDPGDVALKASYGWFAFRQNCRPDAGLAAVLAGIEQDPSSAELRYLEAELQRLLAQPGAAVVAIRAASELEPDSAYYKRQVRRFEALAKGQPEPESAHD